MIIRPAAEADLPALLAIYNDAILNTTASWDYDIHTLEMRREWFQSKRDAGHPVFVAEDEAGGAVTGFSAYGPFRAWKGYRFTVENSVYVAPGLRGRGIGRLLMPPLIEAARAQGMHTIVAGVAVPNDASIRLHQSFGFEQVACFKQVGFKFDQWLDLVFLQLML